MNKYNLRIELIENGVIIETFLKNYRRGLNCAKVHLGFDGIFDTTNNKDFIISLCKNRLFESRNIKAYII